MILKPDEAELELELTFLNHIFGTPSCVCFESRIVKSKNHSEEFMKRRMF